MTIEEFRNEFIKQIRFEAEHNGTSPDEQFISTAIENLEDLGEFTDPYPMSCYIRGKHNRIMAFDCYGYDEADVETLFKNFIETWIQNKDHRYYSYLVNKHLIDLNIKI